MKCPKCQLKNPVDAKFCNECGNKLELTCKQCGKINPPGSKFCNACGHALNGLNLFPALNYAKPQSYTPKFLADKILTTRSSIEGERKLVTVLFADVANYTSISEKIDPEEIHQIMDGCFKILMEEIHKYEGTINQFTGDGVMALFGAPLAHEDHAQRACQAALSIQTTIAGYGTKIESERGIEFKMRIGINSGPVMVGAIGDDLRMDYTAVGDTTNLAARMETMAHSGTILISKNTQRLVQAYFELKPLGPIPVKGKEKPQQVFELIKSSSAVATRFEASVSKGLTRFVGRENSLAAMNSAWIKAISGSGQVLGIVGEAGVGKSRLLLEFRNSLSPGGFTYLEGRCFNYGDAMSYLPFLDILRSYFDIKEGADEAFISDNINARLIALDERLVPDSLNAFQDLLSIKVKDEAWQTLAPKEKRERAFEALRDLMIRISQEKPLVLAIEDLHWLDKTSDEFLSYFIDWLTQSRILLILCYRPEYRHIWHNKSYYGKIGLNQLTGESSAELISAIFESDNVVPELKQLILNRAAGNPLFMEEFTHSLLENGSIEKKDNRLVLSPQFSAIQVPDTIQGIIAARMDRLEDNLKRTMQVASVIGRDFAFRILQSITGMHAELKSYLLNLQRLEFIYEKQLFPELEYIFKHALTQEVAYSSLLLKKRKELHGMIGRAIEKIYASRLEEFYEMIAYHYSKSDNHEPAYHYLKLSGDKAIRRHSAWEAYLFYKDSIDALRRLPETEENQRKQLEVIRLTHDPMWRLGFPEKWLGMLQHGEKLARRLGAEKSLALINLLMARYYIYHGGPFESSRYLDNSLQKALKIEDVEIIAQTAVGLLMLHYAKGDVAKVPEVALPVIELLEKTNKQSELFGQPYNVYAYLCVFSGQCIGCMGDFVKGIALCEKGLLQAFELDDSFTLNYCEYMYGALLNVKHDLKPAIKHLLKALSYFEKVKFKAMLGLALSHLVYAYTNLGDLKSAGYYLAKFLKLPNSDRQNWIYFSNVFLSAYHIASGDPRAAKSACEEALRLSKQVNNKFGEGFSLITLGRSLGIVDPSDSETAIKTISKGVEILETLKLKAFSFLGYLYLGELYSTLDIKKEANNNFQKAKSMCKEMGINYWLPKIRVILANL